MIDKIVPALQRERQSTDQSLDAEREKTNRSIEKARHQTERAVDHSVNRDRLQTDKDLGSTRDDADHARDLGRGAPNYDPEREQKLGDERVRRERRRSDEAIEIERARSDGAMVKERAENSQTAARLLRHERLRTDTNLRAERQSIDSTFERRAKLLDVEIANHLQTKVSLTSRDEIIAIVSHDLRNPIGAASTCLDILIEDAQAGDANDETKYWLALAKRNVDTSLRLISDLLDIERIAHGKFELNLTSHEAGALIRETFDTFAHVAAAKRITLKDECASATLSVDCDHDRTLQVLSNLVSNAIKFTEEGGTVCVRAVSGPDGVEFSVADDGVGIPPDKLEQIFDRFAQLGVQDRRGLGLGLYISKMFVEAHGGKMWVESTPGEGSTFTLRLPGEAQP